MTEKQKKPKAQCLYALLAVLIGFGFFWYAYGFSVLNPRNVEWLMHSDRSQHLLGALFFFNEPWSLPPGKISGFIYPVGTSVAYTDSIPLLALFFKLFAAQLGFPFQYSGIWLLICYLLQSIFGYATFRLLKLPSGHSLLGAAFLVFSPALLECWLHIALCGHWVILGGMCLYLLKKQEKLKRILWPILICVSLGVHAYLAAMVLCIFVADLIQRLLIEKSLAPSRAFGELAIGLLLVCAALWFYGYLVVSSGGASGFGHWSADILTFFSSADKASIWPWSPKFTEGQHEGFAYLGFGLICILSVVPVYFLKSGFRKKHLYYLPLLTVAVLLFFFALSSKVTVNGTQVFSLEPVYSSKPLAKLVGTFRASGRFVWVLYYLLIIACVATTAKLLKNPKYSLVLLSIALFLQIYDLQNFFNERTRVQPHYFKVLNDAAWEELGQEYKHLNLVPFDVPLLYGGKNWGDKYFSLAYFAAEHKMTFNSGSAARLNYYQSEEILRQYKKEPLSLYILRDSEGCLQKGDCMFVEDFCVCF